MRRIILTTCGTSLFRTSCWKLETMDRMDRKKKLNEEHISKMDRAERGEYELVCRNILETARKKGEDISSSFDTVSWENMTCLRYLPAELASLRAIQVYFKSRKEPLGEGDKVILLHSDNDEGSYCAETIHKVLKKFDLLSGVEIDTWEVKGLDPRDFGEFGSALENIWSECIQRFPQEDSTEYIFNLTGGYKGTAILLGAFAYLRGLDTRIFYLHGETNYEQISIMGFDKSKCKEERFCAGYFDIRNRKSKPIFGTPNSFDK